MMGFFRERFHFHILITRLVYRDASRLLGFALGFLVMLQIFVVKYIPPWDIRDAILGASLHSHSIFVVLMLVGYVALTQPILRILIGSERLRFFRHLPVSHATWSWIHLRHMWLINLLWFGIAWYGLFTGSQRPALWQAVVWGFWWCQQVTALQVAVLLFSAQHSRIWVLCCWSAAAVLTYALLVSGWMWLVALLGIVWSILAFRWLQYPAPMAEARTTRLLPTPKKPLFAMLRLAFVGLQRQSKQSLWMGLVGQAFLGGIVALAVANNGFTPNDEILLLRILFPLLLVGALFGASVALQVIRLQQPALAWSLHLPLPASIHWFSLVLCGALWGLIAPVFLLLGSWFGGLIPSMWLVLCACGLGVVCALWAGLLVVYVGYRAAFHENLDESQFFAMVAHSFVPLLLIAWFPWAGVLLLCWGVGFGVRGLYWFRTLIFDMKRMPPMPLDYHTS